MRHRGFTLVELLVVIIIIAIVIGLAAPAVMNGLSARQTGEAARLLQAQIAGARDVAIRDNAPTGLRLMPDPEVAGAYNGMLPLTALPDYAEGIASGWSGSLPPAVAALAYMGPGLGGKSATLQGLPLLMVVEEVLGESNQPNPPTNWFWNVRLGDRIQFNGAGPWYTVIGPMGAANADGFVNLGFDAKGNAIISPLPNQADFLLLSNGRDDNNDGMIDTGWNGLDDDGANGIDDVGEWAFSYDPQHPPETESWGPIVPHLASYTLRRRSAPGSNARTLFLPSHVVIDIARSKLPTSPLTGSTDLLVYPDGSIRPSLIYSTPASISLGGNWYHFWIADRSDVGTKAIAGNSALVSANGNTGLVTTLSNPDPAQGYAQAMRGVHD